MSALLIAVRDQLREKVTLSPDDVRVQPGPEPIPTMGDTFISVYGSGWNAGISDPNRGIDEVFGVACAVTSRMSANPIDRVGEEIYIKGITGLEATCRKIVANVHQNIDVFTEANLLITGDDKFVEFLRWSSTDPSPKTVGADWFFSSDTTNPDYGLVMEVRFVGARRVQAIANIE